MAAADSFDRQPTAPAGAIGAYGLLGVLGATGCEAAMLTQERTQGYLISPYQN